MIIDTAFEDRVLACLLKSKEFNAAASQHIKPSYFEGAMKHNLAKAAIDFYSKYRVKISAAGFVDALKELTTTKTVSDKDVSLYAAEFKRLLAIDCSDHLFTLEKLIIFIKNRETRKLIEDSVKKHLPKNDFAAIEKGMQEIANITTLNEAAPYDYFDVRAIEERTLIREKEALEKRIGISTGIKRMDDHFPNGGWFRKELYTILAPPKRGKTMSLQFFANVAALQGFNVAIFTLETSREVYCSRLDAMNASIEIKRLSGSLRETAEKVKALKAEGRLFIYEYPTKRLTVSMIERQLRRLEIEQGVEIDILFVDYADILKPERHYSDKLQEQATIYEDLRALAVIMEIPVITASQVNRVGSEKITIKGTDIAGSFEKVMVCDAIISLSASEKDLADKKMKLHFAECRNMESKTLIIGTAYNYGRFYREFLGEYEGETDKK